MAFTTNGNKAGLLVFSGLAVVGGCALMSGCSKPTSLVNAAAVGTEPPKGENPGPVRMARISYETGKASWRPDGTTGWTATAVNMPVRQGAEIWLAPQSRLEMQFDDGATVHLGNGAVATIQTLYSDNKGEFTEVKLSAGDSSWALKNKDSIYQIDAPCDSVKSTGPSTFRVDVNPKACSLAVRKGDAVISTKGKDTPVSAGHNAILASADDPVTVETAAPEDDWDRDNDNRDAILADPPSHVPADIGLVSGGLDRDGDWHNVENVGYVWTPRESPGWRPYHAGHWAWVDPYGWTWVSAERWGWAPYHYGTWAHFGFGWGWAPGPAVQYWSPARVDFVESDGYVTWAPLAPQEVTYPEFSVGFGGSNWYASFSIGACGVYEPYSAVVCQPIPYAWNSYYGPDRRDGWGPRGWGQHNFAFNNTPFVPRNSVFGAVSVNSRDFSGSAQFRVMNGNVSNSFRNGRQVVANREAFSGPVNVRPSALAFSPSRNIVSNARPAALDRALVRGRMPANVERSSGSFGRQMGSRNVAAMPNGNRVPNAVVSARRDFGARGTPGTASAAPRGVGNVIRTPRRAAGPAATPRVLAGRRVAAGNGVNRGGHTATTRNTVHQPAKRQPTGNRRQSTGPTHTQQRRATGAGKRGGGGPVKQRGNRGSGPVRQNNGNRGGGPTRQRGNRGGGPVRQNNGNRGGGGPTRQGGNRGGGGPTRQGGNRGGGGPTRQGGNRGGGGPTKHGGGGGATGRDKRKGG